MAAQVRLDPENNGVMVARVSWDNVREGAMITDILPKLKGAGHNTHMI